jgi:predicted TIM-barrel fold metal-dependent hydrolase
MGHPRADAARNCSRTFETRGELVDKRPEGRDEEILEPDLPIIDSHHHLRDRRDSHYLFEDYLSDVRAGHDIRASVYVESLAMARPDGPEVLRPLGEIEFANGMGAMGASGTYGSCRVASAIVGYADLRQGDAVAELLDRSLATAPDRYRGIRQVTLEHTHPAVWRYVPHPPPEGIMRHPGFRPALKHLAARDLSFDAALFHHQLPELTEVAADFPGLTVVLNHLGQVAGLALAEHDIPEAFVEWRQNMTALAANPNVVCKIGGLGQPFFGFGFETRAEPTSYRELAEAWRPWVEAAIEIFGAERCMMESNFPADARSCGFVPLWNALKHIVGGASDSEKAALFHGTAARVYRIPDVV